MKIPPIEVISVGGMSFCLYRTEYLSMVVFMLRDTRKMLKRRLCTASVFGNLFCFYGRVQSYMPYSFIVTNFCKAVLLKSILFVKFRLRTGLFVCCC